ncbi:MAG TPA: GNAT family N-acetyltransferase [Xanthobacteraceae bacterium]
MSEPASRLAAAADDYALVPAVTVEHAPLADFVATIWPDLAPQERIRAFWWMRAAPEFAVAAVHRGSGAMAGLCGGRHCTWSIAGATQPAVAICDWYVAPSHAGKGLGKRLVQHFDQSERFLYAFSISDAAIANFQKLGWAGPFRSSLMLLLIPPRLARHLAGRRSRHGLQFERFERAGGEALGALGDALDAIEARRRRDLPAHMRRDAAEWSWRLSVCGERRYRMSVARRGGEPVGYVAVRPMTPGRSRSLDRLRAAMITDFATTDDDPALLAALAGEAVAIAADLGARAVVTATTTAAHRSALTRMGFISPTTPLLGRLVASRSPQFMWLPRGPAAALAAGDLALSFADVAIDLDL